MNDKETEKKRYDDRLAAQLLATLEEPLGAARIPEAIRSPYLEYEHTIEQHAFSGVDVLDLCCGDGQYSFASANKANSITGLDISRESLKAASKRAEKLNTNCKQFIWTVGDCENLPFEDESFDLITMAGALSYGRIYLVKREILRVLKKEGTFICVDSLDHNPIYRANRFIHYLKGERSLATLKNMPTTYTIETIAKAFKHHRTTFFGTFAFLAPIFNKLRPSSETAQLLESLDRFFPGVQSGAFKFVLACSRKNATQGNNDRI